MSWMVLVVAIVSIFQLNMLRNMLCFFLLSVYELTCRCTYGFVLGSSLSGFRVWTSHCIMGLKFASLACFYRRLRDEYSTLEQCQFSMIEFLLTSSYLEDNWRLQQYCFHIFLVGLFPFVGCFCSFDYV